MSITDEFPYATTFIDDLQQNINPTTFYKKKIPPLFPGQKKKKNNEEKKTKRKRKRKAKVKAKRKRKRKTRQKTKRKRKKKTKWKTKTKTKDERKINDKETRNGVKKREDIDTKTMRREENENVYKHTSHTPYIAYIHIHLSRTRIRHTPLSYNSLIQPSHTTLSCTHTHTMFLHLLTTAAIIKNVRATVRGQYDYYIAEAAFLNSDSTEANLSIEAYIPLHDIDCTTISRFRKDDVVEAEGSITANTNNTLKVSLLHFSITQTHLYIICTLY